MARGEDGLDGAATATSCRRGRSLSVQKMDWTAPLIGWMADRVDRVRGEVGGLSGDEAGGRWDAGAVALMGGYTLSLFLLYSLVPTVPLPPRHRRSSCLNAKQRCKATSIGTGQQLPQRETAMQGRQHGDLATAMQGRQHGDLAGPPDRQLPQRCKVGGGHFWFGASGNGRWGHSRWCGAWEGSTNGVWKRKSFLLSRYAD